MPFLSVFLRTLGFLTAIATFVILINLLAYIIPQNDEYFKFTEGDRDSKNIIATLELNGPIVNNIKVSPFNNILKFIDPELVQEYLLDLEKRKAKILIIKINSPGGTVTATAELEKIIKNFKKRNTIKVYFYTNEILASGGYWIATTGDKIFANYGSIIGSIGVSGPSWYYYNNPTSISKGILSQNIETKNGIEIFDQYAGYSKDLYNPFRKPNKKELDHLQDIVTEIYNDFLNKVSKSRKIEINILKNDIGALIYSGNQAKEKFLIDDVLDYELLIKNIIKNKKYENYKILQINNNENFIDKYLTSFFGLNSKTICNKLNVNFVSVLPLFINNC